MDQKQKDLEVAFCLVRDLIRENRFDIGTLIIASLPDHVCNDEEDNYLEIEKAGDALVLEMADFAGKYIADGLELVDHYAARERLEEFMATARSSFEKRLTSNNALDRMAENAKELGLTY